MKNAMSREDFLVAAKKKFADAGKFAKIKAAVDFASEKHKGQKRLNGEDYISHPLAVAKILLEWEMDFATVLAGILHDTVEDTDTTLEEIREKFGEDVAKLVDGVTKVGRARAGRDDIATYLPQTKDNLTKLLIATGADVRVLIIKLADRLQNLRTLEFQPAKNQIKTARESLEIFGPLADRLNMGRARMEIEDISFRYLAPARYNKLRSEIDLRVGAAKKQMDKIREEISRKLAEEKLPFEIDGRIKSVYSLHKKLTKKQTIDEIYDLIALRIIVADIPTCYLVLGEIHTLYEPLEGRIKDYIARPKENGYQSLHTTVKTRLGKDESQIVEFQIRTREMHEFAERGLAASFHYNEQKLSENYAAGRVAMLPHDLAWIRELQEAAAKISSGEKVDFAKLKLDLFSDRIFVYSPKRDIFDLPRGALPLDFAYLVHSDLASRAAGFRVNGKIAKFDTELKSGDTVEILTRKNILPHLDWLKKIVTSHARNKLRAQLREEEKLGFAVESLGSEFANLSDTAEVSRKNLITKKRMRKKERKAKN